MEIWKILPNSSFYQISNYGNIRQLSKYNFSSYKTKEGYTIVNYKLNNGKRERTTLSKLMCKTFYKNPPSSEYSASYIDGNKDNNHISNLQWTHVKKIKNKAHTPLVVYKICKNSGEVIRYESRYKASEKEGVSPNTISYRCKTNYEIDGYIWSYDDKNFRKWDDGWIKVPGYKYYVNKKGQIRTKSKILEPKTNNCGYYTVHDNTKGYSSKIQVHTLICEIFHGNKPSYNYNVYHINGIKTDNRAENLKWISKSEQALNKVEYKTRGFVVCKICPNTNKIISKYKSAVEIAEYYGLFRAQISKIINDGKLFEGYYWKYEIIENLEGEIWKEIEDTPGFYVSNMGRIKDKKDREVFTKNYNNGYKRFNKYSIHRLVALYFIPNPDNYNVVNHKNGNKEDNRVENLEWCTYSQNSQHAIDNKLYKIGKTVYKIDNETNEVIKKYNSVKEAAEEEKITGSSLTGRIRRKTIKNGYYFTFKIFI